MGNSLVNIDKNALSDRIGNLMSFVAEAEKDIFNIEEFKKIQSHSKKVEKYNLAKQSLTSDMNIYLKVVEMQKDMDTETEMLLKIIMTMSPDLRLVLRDIVRDMIVNKGKYIKKKE